MLINLQRAFLVLFCYLHFGCGGSGGIDPAAINALKDAGFKKGVHYDVVAKPLTDDITRPSVTEFFWYGCSHCLKLERPLKGWLKTLPPSVTFIKYPAIWADPMELHARAFFVAEKVGHPELGDSLFQVIMMLREEKDSTRQRNILQKHFERFHISEAEFNEMMDSEETSEKVEKAKSLQKQAKVSGTPSLIINGAFKIKNDSVEGPQEQLNAASKMLRALSTLTRETGTE